MIKLFENLQHTGNKMTATINIKENSGDALKINVAARNATFT